MTKMGFRERRKAALWAAALAVLPHAAAFAQPSQVPAPEAPPVAVSAARNMDANLQVGDRLKLSFYERLDSDEDRWRSAGGRSVEVPREFHDRAELSGEYAVQDDGSISLPLIGRFMAAGATPSAFVASLQTPFEALIGRKGMVSALSVVRRPIYIVGPVKTPGAYAFEAGLTPLHAIALAGGLRQDAVDNWQQVETGRQMEQLARSLEHVKRFVVRTFVLKTSRDGDKAEAPRLDTLVGAADLASLSADEKAQRELVDVANRLELSTLRTAVDAARAELKAREDRAEPYEQQTKLLAERYKSLQQLADKNVIGKTVLIQAQSDLANVQDRQNQAALDAEAAKEKLAHATQDLAKAETQTKIEITRAISAAEKDASDAVADTTGDLNVIRALMATRHAPSDVDAVDYEIVRRGPDGATLTFKAAEIVPLEPGDLVRVRVRTSDQPEVANR